MDVTVEVVGEGTREVSVGADGTYADLIAAVDLSPHEVSVLVDGSPVPEDQPVESTRVKVLRLIKGGSTDSDGSSELSRTDPSPSQSPSSPRVQIRTAVADDLVGVMRQLDAAVLEADAGEVRARIDVDEVFVAETDDRVVGALVLDGSHIDAVAVQKERRGRGVGTALVAAAADRVGDELTADFDERVRPFYASLGFDIETRGTRGERYRGRLRGTVVSQFGISPTRVGEYR